jgi:nucleoside phosphorylase
MAAEESFKVLTHDDYTVGWVCSLPKEQTAAVIMLDEEHPSLPTPPNDSNAYTLGSIDNHNVVIACLAKGQTGTTEAGIVATRMLTTFPSIRVGLMVGIGSGIPSNNVRLGDVVISTPTDEHPGVVHWDLGKIEAHGIPKRTGALNNPPKALLTAVTLLETEHDIEGSKVPQYLEELKIKKPKVASKYCWSASLTDPLAADGRQNEYREPEVHYGLIASGNRLIKDGEFRDKLNESLGGNVLCFEMEAAGLMNNFPCIVIRGIWDYADSQKNYIWQEYAATVAAACAKELLGFLEPSKVVAERPMKEILEQSESPNKSM